jgi:hypothetical protein
MRGIRLSSEVAAWIGQNLKSAVSGNTHDVYLWIDVDGSEEDADAAPLRKTATIHQDFVAVEEGGFLQFGEYGISGTRGSWGDLG